MVLGRGALGRGARDPSSGIVDTNNNYHRCREDATNCILFTCWTKDGIISGGTCEQKIKLRTNSMRQ